MVSEVFHLGYTISEEGMKPMPKKVAATVNSPWTVNIPQLHSFLGLLLHYRFFWPNLPEIQNFYIND